MILDMPQLLAPIPGDAETGIDLRSDAAGDTYYRMKDARSTARAAEREADSNNEPISRPPEWRTLLDLAQEALAGRTKDLEIAAWLTEAALRLHGFAGLRDGFALMDGLVEHYWDRLFSVDTETAADKVSPLVGLNGSGADGTLIQPIRLSPLTTPADGAGLWHFTVARRGGADAAAAQQRIDTAMRATEGPTYVAVVHDLRDALAVFTGLCDRLDAVCGPDAPPSANIRNTLSAALEIATEIAGPALLATPAASAVVADVEGAPASVAAPAIPGVIAGREDALRQLSRIAAYFQETEPNSPTGYVLETLVRRARLPIADLLRELLPDDTVRQSLLTGAGIGAPKPAVGE